MWQVLSAQDRIITVKGDTIFCRIVSMSDNHIVYEQHAGEKQVSGKIIQLSEVAEYFRAPVTKSYDEIYISRTPEHPWLFSLSLGGGHMPWLLENVEEESAGKYKNFSNGLTLNATVHYLITNNIGFGVQYSFFTSKIKNNDPAMISSFPLYTSSDTRERQYINYAGLSVIFRQFLDNKRKFSFSETLGGGLLLYRAEEQSKMFMPYYDSGIYQQNYYGQVKYVNQNSLITGNTFGATIGISAEYKILPNLSIGIGGGFLYGSLSKINSKYKDSISGKVNSESMKPDNSLNLSRIDYSLVLRFQL
jgi:hypothetical protein